MALCATTSLAQPPELNDARVTLPYPELKSLWEAARAAKEPEKAAPPIDAALLSARYDLTLKSGYAEGLVEIELQCFADEWTMIRLIASDTQIDKVEPADMQVINRDGAYIAMVKGVQRKKITLHFASPTTTVAVGESISIPWISAPIRTLTIHGLPKTKTATLNGGTLIATADGASSYRLPGDKAVQLVIATPAEPPLPSHWKTETEAMVHFSEGRLRYESHVSAFAQDGSGLELELGLPQSARVLEVKGEDLSRWNAAKTLAVHWKTRDYLTREFEIIYEIPQPATAGRWKLQAPSVLGADQGQTLYALAGEQGLDLQPVKPTTKAMGRWLAQCASKETVSVVGSDGEVDVKWLPLVATTTAVIDLQQSKTRVVSDGALLNESTYVLRHQGPLVWRLTLPAGSQLLTCSINGQRTNPVDRGENILEFLVPADAEKSVAEVKLSYTAKKPPFEPISGKLEVELPQTDLLIHKIEWDLQIPPGYDLTATEGNTETVPGGSRGVVQMRKELCKNEQPSTRIYYQKPEAK
ncbi:MAG: hypothetical protein WCP06_02100 [Verrucomicrobiota bacterium]